eukprot:SAG11_NODE_43736_length_162_cov_34.555556_1_plen_31_part_01
MYTIVQEIIFKFNRAQVRARKAPRSGVADGR